MVNQIFSRKSGSLRIISALSLLIFTASAVYPAVYNLPEPGMPLKASRVHSYPLLKGLRIDPANPLHIEFIVDTAGCAVTKDEAGRLVSYFLAGLTLPEDSLWVN